MSKRYSTSTSIGRRKLRAGTTLAIALVAAGCTAGIKGRSDLPDRIATQTVNPSVYASEIEQALREAAVAEAYYCLAKLWACSEDVFGRRPTLVSGTAVPSAAELIELRDAYVNAMTRAHKLALEDYARALTVEGGSTSFLAHLSELGLNVAAGISRVQETSRILNALAVGVIGIDSRYDEQVLLGQTIPALLDKMRAAQLREIAAMLERRGASVTDYPLSAARADVVNLSAVVNIETAVQALAKEAQEDRQDAEQEEKDARVTVACRTDLTPRLEAWLGVDDAEVQVARLEAAQRFLSAQGITGTTVAEFMRDCTQAPKHLAMISELGIK